ncbi:MAG: general secretion pathway protein GspF [Gammaproteobacteria bacterium]|nr:general secretion pathway protein GspF [Gammaproteobacteria bacterium]MBU1653967.1 general secretion pathway protein GspF [Gammaproteobacteria bacterium]MBU1961350.1 general secretion pathway protein GspF [Gammaproteobacteria bacterium]
MGLKRARSAEEFAEMVKQAVFEVDDLRDCFEFEVEDLHKFPNFLEPLEQGIKRIYRDMCDGNYRFGREDLPFMELAMENSRDIPFLFLLKRINETHRRGIDVDGEDE